MLSSLLGRTRLLGLKALLCFVKYIRTWKFKYLRNYYLVFIWYIPQLPFKKPFEFYLSTNFSNCTHLFIYIHWIKRNPVRNCLGNVARGNSSGMFTSNTTVTNCNPKSAKYGHHIIEKMMVRWPSWLSSSLSIWLPRVRISVRYGKNYVEAFILYKWVNKRKVNKILIKSRFRKFFCLSQYNTGHYAQTMAKGKV